MEPFPLPVRTLDALHLASAKRMASPERHLHEERNLMTGVCFIDEPGAAQSQNALARAQRDEDSGVHSKAVEAERRLCAF